MAGVIRIDDLAGPRFDAALELLREGGGFSFEGVVFCYDAPGVLHCVVNSSRSLGQVTRATAAADVSYAAAVFERVRTASPEFCALTQGASRRTDVIYDYWGETIVLASCERDQLTMCRDTPGMSAGE